MDKEAQEKIAILLFRSCNLSPWEWCNEDTKEFYMGRAKQVVSTLEGLGCRKLPKDKPPLLSDEEITKIIASRPTGITLWHCNDVAQAQREADIKHYETLLSR